MLRKALATLPPTLDETYDRILCAIKEEDSEYALHILRWLTFSARPLCVEEVAEVVAIDTNRNPAFDHDDILEDPLEVLDICSSLVTLTTVSGNDFHDRPFNSQRIVALAHYSVQEYLVSDRIRQGDASRYSLEAAVCHNAIMQDCLHYVLQFQQLGTRPSDIIDKFALAIYSATFWPNHVIEIGDEIKHSCQLVLDLLSSVNPAYANWVKLYVHYDKSLYGVLAEKGGKMPKPLYCAAKLGMSHVVKLLLEAGANANATSGYFRSGLLTALYDCKDEEAKKVLLKAGAAMCAIRDKASSPEVVA
jgi:hypothetical protein